MVAEKATAPGMNRAFSATIGFGKIFANIDPGEPGHFWGDLFWSDMTFVTSVR